MFRRTPIVTIRSSIKTFRLKLWDTESESLIPFPSRPRSDRRYGIPPGGEAAVLGRRQGIASD